MSLVQPALAQVEDIEKLYRKQCGVCHGDEGDGRGRASANLQPPPSSFISPNARLDKQSIIRATSEGKPGTAMAAYGRRFSEEQLNALADYILANFVSVSSSSASLKSGKQLYIEHCSACHGDNGNTAVWAKNGLNPPPRDFTHPKAREELSRERMINSVTHGRPGTGMMSFQRRLSAQEIERVVDFIRSSFMGAKPVSSRGDSKVTQGVFPNGLLGDKAWGKSFYMRNCFTCHGEKGDGKGPRAHFNRPPPRDFTSLDTQQHFSRERLFLAIQKGKRGTVMPAWETVLTDQQVANVAEFVYTEFVKKKP